MHIVHSFQLETGLGGGRNLRETIVWEQQMVADHLHISTGCGHADARSIRTNSGRVADHWEADEVIIRHWLWSQWIAHYINCPITRHCRDVPRYKQRIAGKSLPMEKFAIKKSERFAAQKNKLTLPAVELMYLWNAFKVLGKHFHLADTVYKLVESASNELSARAEPSKYDADNRALVLLLKGACLRQMQSPLQARRFVIFYQLQWIWTKRSSPNAFNIGTFKFYSRCLEAVIALHKDIKEDHYLVPYAIVEIGLIYADEGKFPLAIAALEDAKYDTNASDQQNK